MLCKEKLKIMILLWYFDDTSRLWNREVSFYYLTIYQVFISFFKQIMRLWDFFREKTYSRKRKRLSFRWGADWPAANYIWMLLFLIHQPVEYKNAVRCKYTKLFGEICSALQILSVFIYFLQRTAFFSKYWLGKSIKFSE